jgi:hypothetical protein
MLPGLATDCFIRNPCNQLSYDIREVALALLIHFFVSPVYCGPRNLAISRCF